MVMELGLILFFIGSMGFIFNRNNLILMIIAIEIILLAVAVIILINSFIFNDLLAETYGIYIISIAGAESAIGLAILLAYFKMRKKSLDFKIINSKVKG